MVLRLPLSFSVSSLQRLRSAFVAAIWSRSMPLAHTGGVLTMLDGPVVWCRFRLFLVGGGGGRLELAYGPLEVRRLYFLLDLVSVGCPGHGPVHLLVQRACVLGEGEKEREREREREETGSKRLRVYVQDVSVCTGNTPACVQRDPLIQNAECEKSKHLGQFPT